MASPSCWCRATSVGAGVRGGGSAVAGYSDSVLVSELVSELVSVLVSVLGPGLKLALRLLAALARATPTLEIELTIISERHRKRMIILNEIGMLTKCVPL